MGTYKKEPRCIWHHFRVTEKEEIQIRRDMSNADYLSMSKYFRDMILKRKVTLEKVHITDRTTRNQINDHPEVHGLSVRTGLLLLKACAS